MERSAYLNCQRACQYMRSTDIKCSKHINGDNRQSVSMSACTQQKYDEDLAKDNWYALRMSACGQSAGQSG